MLWDFWGAQTTCQHREMSHILHVLYLYKVDDIKKPYKEFSRFYWKLLRCILYIFFIIVAFQNPSDLTHMIHYFSFVVVKFSNIMKIYWGTSMRYDPKKVFFTPNIQDLKPCQVIVSSYQTFLWKFGMIITQVSSQKHDLASHDNLDLWLPNFILESETSETDVMKFPPGIPLKIVLKRTGLTWGHSHFWIKSLKASERITYMRMRTDGQPENMKPLPCSCQQRGIRGKKRWCLNSYLFKFEIYPAKNQSCIQINPGALLESDSV